jgi:hypothetical protein
MASQKLEAGTLTSIATTALNSLAANAGALSDAYDNSNSSNLFLWGSLELLVGFASNPAVGALIDVHLLTAMDGSNYAEGTTGASAATQGSATLVGSFVVARAQTAAQRLVLGAGGYGSAEPLIRMPPSLLKFLIVNRAAVAFAATSNVLKILPIRLQA